MEALPRELVLLIFEYLSVEDILMRVSLVCKDWKLLAKDERSWQLRVNEKYGSVEINDQLDSALETYRHLSGWHWEAGRSGIVYSDMNRTVCKEGSLLSPVISDKSISPTCRHALRFELTVGNMPSRYSLAIGVADRSFLVNQAYLHSNNGIGWFAAGDIWSKGQKLATGAGYGSGDRVGIDIDFPRRILRFLVNGKPVNTIHGAIDIDISWITKPLHIASMVLVGTSLTIDPFPTRI